jgi:hypothetical protein
MVYCKPGDTIRLEIVYSEAAMSMRIAGTVRNVRITEGPRPMAQVLNDDGSEYSFPITLGEAGIYTEGHDRTDDLKYYYYPPSRGKVTY